MSEQCKCSDDTKNLLKECNSGTKMAVASFDEVMDKVSDGQLKKCLQHSKELHESIGDKIHEILNQCGCEDKEPNPIAKGMSWFKTNIMMTMKDSDKTVADLITDGCDMGAKSLSRYMNQYSDADEESKKICRTLIEEEEKLRDALRKYL